MKNKVELPVKQQSTQPPVKVVLLGDCAVGKSMLVSEVFTSEYNSTIGASVRTKLVNVEDEQIKFDLWDLSGQKRYASTNTISYANAAMIVLVFDKTNMESFKAIPALYTSAKKCVPDAQFVLVGTKADLVEQEAVGFQMANNYACELNIPYIESSAKNRNSLNELFTFLANLLLEKFKKLVSSQPAVMEEPSSSQPSKIKSDSSCWTRFFSCCGFGDEESQPTAQSEIRMNTK